MSSPLGEQFGPYLVYEQIGIGGMATVHRAETTGIAGFRRPVALKRMLPHIATNDDFVRSFVREARLASHLRHSNVAQTYDLGKVGDIYFIAMELVLGRTLRDILRAAIKSRIRVPIPITLNILNQVCDALDYAHNLCDDSGTPLGIIHRDVSPSNVIVSESGVVKLIDFGIAKASAAGMQTLSGTIKGKFGYMAPEYLAGKIDARADLFAVGIMGHELLTGKPLFQGRDDMDTLYRVRSMPIRPPSDENPDIPHEIDAIVMTALERDPDARWQRASAMRIALTTEMKRLGLTIIDQQVVEWVEATFGTRELEVDSQPPTRVLQPQGTASIVIDRRHDGEDGDEADEDQGDDESQHDSDYSHEFGAEHDYGAEHEPDDMLKTSLRESSRPLPSGPGRPSRSSDSPIPFPLPAPAATSNNQLVATPERSRPSSVQPSQTSRASAAQPAQAVPPSMRPSAILPSQAAPPLSGARTRPNLQKQRTLHVEASDVLDEVALVSSEAAAATTPEMKRMGNLTILVLLLLTAAAAGAVVYFGLPYLEQL